MDFCQWINGKSIEDKEILNDHTFGLKIDKKRYILKKINSLSEYLIQKDLIALQLPIFQKQTMLLYSFEPIEKILDLDIRKDFLFGLEDEQENVPAKTEKDIPEPEKSDHFYILSKRINGVSLHSIVKKLKTEELESIIQIIFWSLKITWDKLEFVHLDLHLGNILVKKLKEPKTLTLDTNEKKLEIKTQYIPYLIDFGTSITKRYMRPLNPKKTVLHDLWRFLGTLSMFVVTDEQYQVVLSYLSYFVDPMIFQEKKEYYANQWFQILP
jgi:hypothetical protein